MPARAARAVTSRSSARRGPSLPRVAIVRNSVSPEANLPATDLMATDRTVVPRVREGEAVRIVGGELRGRPLVSPKTHAIRPTTDRTRESLFNILMHAHPEAIEGARVLDLFAGTGAVGIEALSRGAASVLFVEASVEGRGLLRTNIEALSLQGRTKIFRRDATALGSAGTIEPFHLLFADPPYATGAGEKALRAAASGGWLVPGALAILEERADVQPACGPEYRLIEERRFGDTRMHFYRLGRS